MKNGSILSSAGIAATFKISDVKFYVPVVTLKTEDNAKLSKLLSEGFKRPIYWNKYKIIFKNYNENEYIRERLDASFQGVNKLFVLPYESDDNNNENSNRKCFLPRIKIENYNIKIDGRNFDDQPIDDWIKQYDEMVEYNKVNSKLSDTQLKKLKCAVKNKTGTTLRTSFKMFIMEIIYHMNYY